MRKTEVHAVQKRKTAALKWGLTRFLLVQAVEGTQAEES
jgi:hypothetical protein